jgi:hypothetical protein
MILGRHYSFPQRTKWLGYLPVTGWSDILGRLIEFNVLTIKT